MLDKMSDICYHSSMLQTELEPKKIGVRDFQHNLSRHINSVKHRPLVVTKHGEDVLLVSDPATSHLKREPKKKKLLTEDLKFFGMYKNRKDWKGKSSAQIARELRRVAWYGE